MKTGKALTLRFKAAIGLLVLTCALCVRASALIAAVGAEPRVVLFLGDSLTAGYGLEPDDAFPALIEKRIVAWRWNFKVVNAGQSGDTTAGGLRRIEWLLKGPIDVLVLALGANDGLRGIDVEVSKKNLQAIIDRTRKKNPRVKIVLAGMQVPPNMGADYSARFRSMFADLAKENRIPSIPFLLEGVGGRPELNLPDGIHPNSEGHKIIAANVWKTLEPLLRAAL